MIGIVVSNKMTGVVAVEVLRIKTDPLYKKRLRRSKKFLAKVGERLQNGDEVEIKEIRPQSRLVHFVVMRVVSRAKALPLVKEEEVVAKKKKEPKVASKEVVVQKEPSKAGKKRSAK
jgi:small subunit ribosomal protein S17